jgi:hypothetical protein
VTNIIATRTSDAARRSRVSKKKDETSEKESRQKEKTKGWYQRLWEDERSTMLPAGGGCDKAINRRALDPSDPLGGYSPQLMTWFIFPLCLVRNLHLSLEPGSRRTLERAGPDFITPYVSAFHCNMLSILRRKERGRRNKKHGSLFTT